MAGSAFSKGGDMCLVLCGNEPRDFAQEAGVSVDRLTVGLAMADNGGIGAVAFRAPGVEPDRLISAGLAIDGAIGGSGNPSVPMTIAGHRAAFTFRLGRSQYLVAAGDVLVFFFGDPPTDLHGSPSPDGTVPAAIVGLVEALP